MAIMKFRPLNAGSRIVVFRTWKGNTNRNMFLYMPCITLLGLHCLHLQSSSRRFQYRRGRLAREYAISSQSGLNGQLLGTSELLVLISPWQCTREDLFAVLRAPLQQLAHFWCTHMVTVSSCVKVSLRAFLDEGCVATVQVRGVRSKCIGQLKENRG
jgi:hypothetical protein